MRDPWVGKTPWRREWLPTPVFWPGEFHGLYSPWGRNKSDTTERLSLSFTFSFNLINTHSHTHTHTHTHTQICTISLDRSFSILCIIGLPFISKRILLVNP